MKIYTFTDLHGDIDALIKIRKRVKASKPELVLCPGDMSIFGSDLRFLMKELDKVNIPVLMLHGNHETVSEMKQSCKGLKNIKLVHRKIYTHKNYKILSYGGGGFDYTDPIFVKTMKEMKQKIKKGDKIILMNHQPPYNTKICLRHFGQVGSKSITAFIKKEQPILALSGHIHEAEGKKQKIGKTLVLNPGYEGVLLNV